MTGVINYNPTSLAPPVGFSHATAANGFVWLAGQTATDVSNRIVAPGDMPGQFRQAIQNLIAALEAARSAPDLVVKLTYFVTDVDAYRASLKEIGEVYREHFGKHYPAAGLFEVRSLFDPDALIEIECVALQRQT